MARLTFLLLLLWVGVTVSTVVDLQKRIVGGTKCDSKDRQYHVALSNNATGDDTHCGGSLIHPQWVLTAAHCFEVVMYAFVGVHPGPLIPMVIQKFHIYLNHDIMLLKLPSPITDIKPVPLPDDVECTTEPQIGKEVQVAGHGKLNQNGKSTISPPTDLQCVTMKVSKCDTPSIKKCKLNEPDDKWICYEGNNVGTCQGDSGGGVEYKGKLRAVHVGGWKYRCTKHCFSLDVCKYKQWIEEKTR